MLRARRLILKLSLCLLAGAVVTWAVAWAMALWVEAPALVDDPTVAYRPSLIDVPPEWPVGHRGGIAANWARTTEFYAIDEWLLRHVVRHDYGWPARAFRGLYIHDDWDTTTVVVANTTIPAPSWTRPRTSGAGAWGGFGINNALPTRVLPLGFALNLALVAGAAFGLIEGAAWSFRYARRRRGRCPWCGYDRAGSNRDAPCPECGALLEHSTPAPRP
jgi:hypothetical protein